MSRVIFLLAAVALGTACSNVDAKLICTSNDDCHEFYACDLAQTQVCLRACETGDECLGSQYCDVPAGEASGVCRDGQALAGGDPGAGDPGGDSDGGDPTGDPTGD